MCVCISRAIFTSRKKIKCYKRIYQKNFKLFYPTPRESCLNYNKFTMVPIFIDISFI